jgi:predicted DNA-binding transcriptional regulator AlpA
MSPRASEASKRTPAPSTLPEVPADWLSPQGLGDWVGVSVKTVYVWNQNGTGPTPTRIGRHVRYSRQAITSWLAARDDTLMGGSPAG